MYWLTCLLSLAKQRKTVLATYRRHKSAGSQLDLSHHVVHVHFLSKKGAKAHDRFFPRMKRPVFPPKLCCLAALRELGAGVFLEEGCNHQDFAWIYRPGLVHERRLAADPLKQTFLDLPGKKTNSPLETRHPWYQVSRTGAAEHKGSPPVSLITFGSI